MKPPEIVDRDHVRFSVFYAVKKVLRAWLGKGDHDPLARKAADGVPGEHAGEQPKQR
jgi:hypothetical protein